jgi:MFS family permease
MSIYLITALNLMNGVALRGSRVVLALFAIELGASAFDIGLLIALSSVVQLLLGVYAGQASDRFGFRLPMLYGSVGGTVAMLTPYVFPSLVGLYVSRALTGMTFIFFMVSLQNLAASISPPQKRAANLTTFSLGQALAGLLGPVAIGVAIDHVGYVRSYLLLGLLALLPLLALGIFRHSVPGARKANARDADARTADLMRSAPLRRALLSGAMVFAASDLLNFYMPIYGHSIGLTATTIGIVLGAHSAAAFVVRLIMPRLLKLATEETLMNACLLASGVIYLLFPLFENAWTLIVIAFLLGLALGCGQPLSMILIYERSPESRTGEALGLRMSINKVMQIGVPLVFGYLGSALGILSVFWTNAVMLLGSGMLSRRAKDRVQPPN